MIRKLAAVAIAISVPGTAGAFDWGEVPGGTVDVYAMPKISVKFDFDDDTRVYADGVGLKSTFKVYNRLVMLAEYQNTHGTSESNGRTAVEVGGTVQQFNLGPGYMLASGTGLFLQYVNVDTGDGINGDGFGVRGRLGAQPAPGTHAFLELGYYGLDYGADIVPQKDNVLELAIGTAATIAGPWSLYLEYKHTKTSSDDPDFDVGLTQDEFRVGVRAGLDY